MKRDTRQIRVGTFRQRLVNKTSQIATRLLFRTASLLSAGLTGRPAQRPFSEHMEVKMRDRFTRIRSAIDYHPIAAFQQIKLLRDDPRRSE